MIYLFVGLAALIGLMLVGPRQALSGVGYVAVRVIGVAFPIAGSVFLGHLIHLSLPFLLILGLFVGLVFIFFMIFAAHKA